MTGVGTVAQLLLNDDDELKISKGNSIWVGVKWSFIYLLWGYRNKLVFTKEEKLLDHVYLNGNGWYLSG